MIRFGDILQNFVAIVTLLLYTCGLGPRLLAITYYCSPVKKYVYQGLKLRNTKKTRTCLN